MFLAVVIMIALAGAAFILVLVMKRDDHTVEEAYKKIKLVQIPDYCKECEKVFLEGFGCTLSLDSPRESLALIQEQLVKGGQPLVAACAKRSKLHWYCTIPAGCYVGEIFCRLLGGRWELDGDGPWIYMPAIDEEFYVFDQLHQHVNGHINLDLTALLDRYLEQLRCRNEWTPRPALRLIPNPGKGGFNKLAGKPCLPDGVEWPVSVNGNTMAFLAQLDLSTVAGYNLAPELPRSGYLFFFYDEEEMPWGFRGEDRGKWKVIYSTRPPGAPMAPPRNLQSGYREKFIAFEPFICSREYSFEDLDNSEERYEHRFMGYSQPVQSFDMELQCQLAPHDIAMDDTRNPLMKELAPGQTDWLLLLQLCSDNEALMEWGDVGNLYFWIRREDLAAADFDNTWVILQCG